MPDSVGDIARELARDAERVCRTYLAGGHREGHYWLAGDVQGSKGRSLYVRLKGGDDRAHARGIDLIPIARVKIIATLPVRSGTYPNVRPRNQAP